MNNRFLNIFLLALMLVTLFSCRKNEYESGGVLSTVMPMANIKALHIGDDVPLKKEDFEGAFELAGIVISDVDNGNFAKNELVVQNTFRGTVTGLIFSFNDESTNFKLGDSVKINIDNTVLTRKNGALKITGTDFKFDRVTKVSSNNVVTPRKVDLISLYSNFYTYESTLVQLSGMSFEGITNGQPYKGEAQFATESASRVYLYTMNTASLADKSIPLVADFVGIPTYFNPDADYYNRAKMLLKIRNSEDVFNETGAPYFGFPETFEGVSSSVKSQYIMPEIDDVVEFSTGPWRLYQAVIGDEPRYDRFNPLNGVQCIRLREKINQSAYLEMKFDLPNGASKVEVVHAIYGLYTTDPKVASAWDLEYSQDEGATWTKIGETVMETNTKNPAVVTFNVNIHGKVRFRIRKLGYDDYPNGQNGMLNIDDFNVYQNVD